MGSLGSETTPSTSTLLPLLRSAVKRNIRVLTPASALAKHGLRGAHALAKHEVGHRLAEPVEHLRAFADQYGAARGGLVEVADVGPGPAGDGLGLEILERDVVVVGRAGGREWRGLREEVR